jgi:hypothetical protein
VKNRVIITYICVFVLAGVISFANFFLCSMEEPRSDTFEDKANERKEKNLNSFLGALKKCEIDYKLNFTTQNNVLVADTVAAINGLCADCIREIYRYYDQAEGTDANNSSTALEVFRWLMLFAQMYYLKYQLPLHEPAIKYFKQQVQSLYHPVSFDKCPAVARTYYLAGSPYAEYDKFLERVCEKRIESIDPDYIESVLKKNYDHDKLCKLLAHKHSIRTFIRCCFPDEECRYLMPHWSLNLSSINTTIKELIIYSCYVPWNHSLRKINGFLTQIHSLHDDMQKKTIIKEKNASLRGLCYLTRECLQEEVQNKQYNKAALVGGVALFAFTTIFLYKKPDYINTISRKIAFMAPSVLSAGYVCKKMWDCYYIHKVTGLINNMDDSAIKTFAKSKDYKRIAD